MSGEADEDGKELFDRQDDIELQSQCWLSSWKGSFEQKVEVRELFMIEWRILK